MIYTKSFTIFLAFIAMNSASRRMDFEFKV